MRFLSTRRRHRMAGLVVLLFGLIVAGGVYYAAAPRTADAETADAQKVEAGRQLFLVSCASCHGKTGEGLGTNGDRNYGPPLAGVGAAAVDFQVGTGRMPMTNSAPQAPAKEPVFNDEETEQLAAFVASLGPGPDVPDEEFTDTSGISDEELAEGGQFFRTNCTACHNSTGAGGALPSGRYAPPLTDTSAKHIYEAMVTGPQQMPVFSDEVITPEQKRSMIAYIEAMRETPQAGIGGGGFGPVSDGVFAWLVGIGGLVLAATWIATQSVRSKRKKAEA
ncbi:cytochrome c [Nocardioidaceae bacterium SCSIO 66511]|nr:cytochrome c [Nocardioidaceae bacterium SCSIO 66511]